MAYLLDTNILGRLADRAAPTHPTATAAVAKLTRRGEVLYVAPQNLVEFRNFATRPVGANGLGLTPGEAEALAAGFGAVFPLVPDTPAIHPAWKAVVAAAGVVGKQVHDARLVAVCHAHGVTHLLTFDVGHFARLAGVGPGVVVVHPASV